MVSRLPSFSSLKLSLGIVDSIEMAATTINQHSRAGARLLESAAKQTVEDIVAADCLVQLQTAAGIKGGPRWTWQKECFLRNGARDNELNLVQTVSSPYFR